MRLKRILPAILTVVVGMAIVPNAAQAFCGPGFSNKAEAVAYYKNTEEGRARVPAMAEWLRAQGFMEADQGFFSFLESSAVVFTTTPSGYVLDQNTTCSGPNINPFNGKLGHGNRGVLALTVKATVKKYGKAKKVKKTKKVIGRAEVKEPQSDGSVDVYEVVTYQETKTYKQKVRSCKWHRPFMKDYCRNLVDGKAFKKCKTFFKKFKKVRTFTKTRLVRKIPPPKGDNPPPPTVVCYVIVYGDNNGNAGCFNYQQCTANGGNWDEDRKVCVIEMPPPGCGSCPPPPCTQCPPPPPKCPDGSPKPPSGECPKPPSNEKPTGVLEVHTRMVDTTAPVCVHSIKDDDGDLVAVRFRFTKSGTDVEVGNTVGGNYTQPGGAECIKYHTPSEPMVVTVTVTLTDNAHTRDPRLTNGVTTLTDNIVVEPE